MSVIILPKLREQYDELMARAKTMRASGYNASADALLVRAWRCAERIEHTTLFAMEQPHEVKGGGHVNA